MLRVSALAVGPEQLFGDTRVRRHAFVQGTAQDRREVHAEELCRGDEHRGVPHAAAQPAHEHNRVRRAQCEQRRAGVYVGDELGATQSGRAQALSTTGLCRCHI